MFNATKIKKVLERAVPQGNRATEKPTSEMEKLQQKQKELTLECAKEINVVLDKYGLQLNAVANVQLVPKR